jgi:ribonuclease HII
MKERLYNQHVAGVDEVGRGPLAGPVMAAAVIMPSVRSLLGLRDSKVMKETQREELYLQITDGAIAWAVGRAEVEEIDRLNILQASLLAMQRAVEGLGILVELALVDGNQAPKLLCAVETIIGGDALEPLISAASVVAKVTRDREMVALDQLYPGYGFAQHKGYGTKAHMASLEEHGPCAIHRRSFAPVRKFFIPDLSCS